MNDRGLNEISLIEMDAKFVEADKNSGITEKKYEDLINDLEKLIPYHCQRTFFIIG